MDSNSGGKKEQKLVSTQPTNGARAPWPYAKRMKGMGVLALVAALVFLLLGLLYGWSSFIFRSSTEPYEILTCVSILSQAILCIPTGIVAIAFAGKKTAGLRKALRVLCVVFLLCSTVLCFLLFNMKKDFLIFGVVGFILAIPILALERQVK